MRTKNSWTTDSFTEQVHDLIVIICHVSPSDKATNPKSVHVGTCTTQLADSLHCNRPNLSRKGAKKGKDHLQTKFSVTAQLMTRLVEEQNAASSQANLRCSSIAPGGVLVMN
jgi:hypothetical protein